MRLYCPDKFHRADTSLRFLVYRKFYDVDMLSCKIFFVEYKYDPEGFGGWGGVLCILEPNIRANIFLKFSKSRLVYVLSISHHFIMPQKISLFTLRNMAHAKKIS